MIGAPQSGADRCATAKSPVRANWSNGWIYCASIDYFGYKLDSKKDPVKRESLTVCHQHSANIPVEPKILGEFGLLKLKTFSLYHENLFIKKVKVIKAQVLTTFFSL